MTKTKKLVVSAVMLALATILSMLKLWEMPWGGSITLFSMLPIIIVAFMYGTKWGLLTALSGALLQMILGATMSQAFAGLDGINVVYMAVLDYIVAFTVLGLGGIFKNVIKSRYAALILGAAVAVLLRYAAHFASGAILWGGYAEWFFSDPEAFVTVAPELCKAVLDNFSGNGLACMYSLIYNGCYMIPELIITVIGAVAVYATKPLRKLLGE
ncbi:MAG: energy-coupled thiamine transporter ThiT [Clostridia bacterium]|nr:energy-coupled thiamine transporter ThiT [Clostridia bacterium]